MKDSTNGPCVKSGDERLPHNESGNPQPPLQDRTGNDISKTPKSGAQNGSAANLRILVVTAIYPEESRPGSGAFVHHQVDHLRRLGHRVDVLHIRGYRSKMNYLKAAFQVWSRTRRRRYDIVHAHYGLCGLPALFRRRTPLVITLHGSDVLIGKIQPLLSLLACSLADASITASAPIASIIPGQVIPTGVDLEVFKPLGRTVARQRLNLPLHERLILFPFDPGRKIKRHSLAQAAVERLRALGHDARLLVASNVPNEEMPWYYNAADAMILCSLSEGSPTAVKEALACELPVVSTDVGDVREVTSGIANTRICAASAEALAAGLGEVILEMSQGHRGARSKLARLDQRQTIASVINVYRSVQHQRRHQLNSPKVRLFHSIRQILAK